MKLLHEIRNKIGILALLFLLPLVGLIFKGKQLVYPFLSFPPVYPNQPHEGFSWLAFVLMAGFILAVLSPFLKKHLYFSSTPSSEPQSAWDFKPFPWWGWMGFFSLIFFWVLAWTRMEWVKDFQLYTFSPLWVSFIFVLNALTFKRTGACLMKNRPGYLGGLFFGSAVFWWYFEYLNRFIGNWQYLHIDSLSPLRYGLFATLAFSTVLPAVLSTFELLSSFTRLGNGLNQQRSFEPRHPRLIAYLIFFLSSCGLALIGVFPDFLYPFLWISPGLIIASLRFLEGKETVFAEFLQGHWRKIFLLGLSGLLCGFFWELWNYYSLAKWIYKVPFVDRFHLFEMPVLGYAGYLPFGIECAIFTEFLFSFSAKESKPPVPPQKSFKLLTDSLLLFGALYFFIYPGTYIAGNLLLGQMETQGIPRLAWVLHKDISQGFGNWAEKRIASKKAKDLSLYDVPSTEWPMFGSVYYLWATENLQRAWEKEKGPGNISPAEYARPAIEAALSLILDPVHHTWVKEHWGADYLHRENLFFRTLLISGILSYHEILKSSQYDLILRDQVESLSKELDSSPYGWLDDYPGECYPIDVFLAYVMIRRADKILGTDHTGFVARGKRAFESPLLDEKGLPPFVGDPKTGQIVFPSRGTGNSYVLIFANELWPEKAKEWDRLYEKYFWQEKWWVSGFREYGREHPDLDNSFEIDAGPILGGFSTAGNAFALAASRVMGRRDHFDTLFSQALVTFWPLPSGRLLGPRLLSSFEHAPYLGESCILFFLSLPFNESTSEHSKGKMTFFVYAGLLFYFLSGFLLCLGPLRRIKNLIPGKVRKV